MGGKGRREEGEMGGGRPRHLGEVDDELAELRVAAGLRLEADGDRLRHRLQRQRPQLRQRKDHPPLPSLPGGVDEELVYRTDGSSFSRSTSRHAAAEELGR
uniref:Uncharacterized protein n=1 Tax=Oryza meridionalis TaxID=40149 RepID=A0A0E0CJL7_9ORYZ